MPRGSMTFENTLMGRAGDSSTKVVNKTGLEVKSKPQPTDMLPTHPISWMQGAFEESIMDSVYISPKILRDKLNAEARRRQLLELEDDLFQGYSQRWRQRPNAKFHPLLKLIAQISFGIHLLHKDQAKSEHEVITILQGHVDEVDGFVEDTTADFELAAQDLQQRIRSLELPLRHGRTFNKMLCDGNFRQAILDGNQIIERVIHRTSKGMTISLNDVAQGIGATQELAKFLDRITPFRRRDRPDLTTIFDTMRGNAEGWIRCFLDLQSKGAKLTSLMAELDVLVNEIAKRAGIASRRKSTSVKAERMSIQSTTRSVNRQIARMSTMNKPLPPDPMHKAVADSALPISPMNPLAILQAPEVPTTLSHQPSTHSTRKRERPQLFITTQFDSTVPRANSKRISAQVQPSRSPSLYSGKPTRPGTFTGPAGLGIVTESPGNTTFAAQLGHARIQDDEDTIKSPVLSPSMRSPLLPGIGSIRTNDSSLSNNLAPKPLMAGYQPPLVSEKEACSKAMLEAIHPGLIDRQNSSTITNAENSPPSYNDVLRQIQSGLLLTHPIMDSQYNSENPSPSFESHQHHTPNHTRSFSSPADMRNIAAQSPNSREDASLSVLIEEMSSSSIVPSPVPSLKEDDSPSGSASSSTNTSVLSPSNTEDLYSPDDIPPPLNIKRTLSKTDAGWTMLPATPLPNTPSTPQRPMTAPSQKQNYPWVKKSRSKPSIRGFFSRRPSQNHLKFVNGGLGGNVVPA